MSDVFGSKARTGSSRVSGTEKHKGGASGVDHQVEWDNDNAGMAITLPTHLAKYKEELTTALYEEFFLANPDDSTASSISEFIEEWVARKQAEDQQL